MASPTEPVASPSGPVVAGPGTVHPRLSVNAICSMRQTLEQDLELWAALGVDHVGLITPKFDGPGWDAAVAAVRAAGLRVSSVSAYKEGLAGAVDVTATLGAPVLYLPTGSGGGATWEEAADRFCADMEPWLAEGRRAGVVLALEPTNPLRSDVSFVHCLRDAVDLARRAGMGVVVDVYSTWYERDLERLVADNIDLVALVQLSDFRLGTFDVPNRVAVGDGDVPLEHFVRTIVAAGYRGAFDLELLGPVIEEEGYRAPLARSLARASDLLERAGA